MRTTIDKLSSGRFRPRIEDPQTRRLKPIVPGVTYATWEEADQVRRDALELLHSDGVTAGPLNAGVTTLRSLGGAFWDRRRRRGSRNLPTDLARWDRYVLGHAIADRPVVELDRATLSAWRDELEKTSRVRVQRNGREIDTGTPLHPRTVRAIFGLVRMVLDDAVHDLGVLDHNPASDVRLPEIPGRKARAYLYPKEDAKLLGARNELVPLELRLLYGFLAREGCRADEARRLDWADVDLDRGILRLDANKTDDPRAWALDRGVLRALLWWQARRGNPSPEEPLFVSVTAKRLGDVRADEFREHLEAVGCDRPELFERSDKRDPIWLHDLRGTFVTISLAIGKPEAWVQDRTGHKSSAMIARYRRAARTAAEVGLGPLLPLDEALPEIRCGSRSAGPDEKVHEGEIVAVPAESSGFLNRWSQVRLLPGAPKDSEDFGHGSGAPPALRGPGPRALVDHARAYAEAAQHGRGDAGARALALGEAAVEVGRRLADLGALIGAGGAHRHRHAVALLELILAEITPALDDVEREEARS